MLVQSSSPHRGANLLSTFVARLLQEVDDFSRRRRQQDFRARLKEGLNPGPGVGDETRTSARSFKDPCWRREPNAGHGVTIQVQNHSCRTIDGVVIRCADVPDPANVSRQTLPSPALAAQNEAQIRSKLGRTDKVVFHSPFAIGKTIRDQYEIALKRRI